MKYIYAYKTSDGKRHEAAMDAESREAVFEALRAKGIKAIKVAASDGSKANGEDSHKKGASRKGETRRVALRRAIFAALLLIPIVAQFDLLQRKELYAKLALSGAERARTVS